MLRRAVSWCTARYLLLPCLLRAGGPEPAAWVQGARRISWGEFERALSLLAAEKDAQVEAVQQAVAGCLGPSHGGPGAGNHVRLHDGRVQTGTQP